MIGSPEYRLLSKTEDGCELNEETGVQQHADENHESPMTEEETTERRQVIIRIPWPVVLCFVTLIAYLNSSNILWEPLFDKAIHPFSEHKSFEDPVVLQTDTNLNFRQEANHLFPKCLTRHPDRLFDRWCDLEHNTAECGYDNSVCQEFNRKYRGRCNVRFPSLLGNGVCDIEGGYNTEDCDWDGGDCLNSK